MEIRTKEKKEIKTLVFIIKNIPMSELLLQTIIEKLGSLEIALLKESNVGKDEATVQALLKEVKELQSEVAKLPFQFKVSDEKMTKLLEKIAALNSTLDQPMENQINHRHHLHKGVWVAVGLFLVSLLFLFGWINTSNTKEQFEANDIKYRFLKANGNSHLIELLYHADSLYNLEKEYFTKQVVLKEQKLAEQAKLLQLTGEKKKKQKN